MLSPQLMFNKKYVNIVVLLLTVWFTYNAFKAGMLILIPSLLLAILVVSFVFYGHALVPLFTRLFKISYVVNEYVFPPGYDVVIKKKGTKYYAAKFMLVNIPEKEELSGTEGFQHDIYIQDFERVLGTLDVPSKFNMVVSAKDITRFREDLQTKVYEISIRIKREMEKSEPDVVKIQHLQSEKERYDYLLKRLAGGVKPVSLVFYVYTVAEGVSPKDARDKATNYAHELKAVLSNNLNVEIVDLAGEDLEMALLFEKRLPVDISDFERYAS